MSDPSELNKAIKAHSMWKIRLKDAIDSGKAEMSASQVKDSHQCVFGKWLDSLPPSEKALDDYKTIIPLHDKFHLEAGNVLQMALNGQKDKAHEALTNITGEFMYTSAKLTNAISEWKRKSA
jgi:methyl-accepting chemotaxis protein